MDSRHQFSRRRFLAGAIATSGALLLAACGGAAPATQPTTAPASSSSGSSSPTKTGSSAPQQSKLSGKITFVCDTINDGHTKVRDGWVKGFMEKNPGVTVDHQTVPQSYNDKIATMFAGGTPPDVYRYLQEVTPIVAVHEKKLHLALDSYISRDSYDLSDFMPEAVNLYRWQGVLYALPRDYGNQNVYMNLDLMQKEGITPPSADWTNKDFTFDKFLEIAQKLTKTNGNRTDQWGTIVNRAARPWNSWVYSNGGTLVKMNDQGLATEMALTEAPAVEAIQFLQDLMYKHKVAPRPDIENEQGSFPLFASGKVGMVIDNPSAVNKYRTITAFKWDVAALPIGKGSKRGSGGGGTGWGSAAATKNPDASWEFLKYISSKDAETDEVKAGATTPSRKSVVRGSDFLDPSKPPKNAKGFADAQEYVVRDPVHTRWPEILSRIVNPNMDKLWDGSTSAQDVAKAIKAGADPLFKS